jgi:hypothetical protein
MVDEIVRSPTVRAIVRASDDMMRVDDRVTWDVFCAADVRALSSAARKRVFKLARTGFRLAVILDRTESTAIVERSCCLQGTGDTNFSIGIGLAWATHLRGLVAPSDAAIMFGHDLDPLFRRHVLSQQSGAYWYATMTSLTDEEQAPCA